MTTLSSHILDTTTGLPVEGITVQVFSFDNQRFDTQTNADGRCSDWVGELSAGTYQIRFHVGEYLIQTHGKAFYPHIDITFIVNDEKHLHVPLLISPFGFSSYRGS
ncbi:hydroxyisourate hydrolase [Aestuariibacter sp. AA17]|uniref:5-hydroxyisourate hydrolase n=1 Tax=Fluctibacter corallii TaxID=2984329 RepID=A0ABT3A6C1_9ALTE|nr:hydroxyisourate hydrolase [Aestuariibacter sp. AA17]MCV2884232.1 hydroxyisourate hydrolase [Aestuariibacter sp. AA17]